MTSSRSRASTSNGGARALLTIALAIIGLIAWGAHADAAPRKRLVVFDFDGPKADKFHDDVVKLLKKSNTVVPSDKWNSTADDLSATKLTDKNIKKVAKKLKIDGVIEGTIEKRRDQYIVRLKVHEGKTGAIVGKTVEAKADSGHLEGDAAKDIKDELGDVIDALGANRATEGDDDAAGDDAPKKKKGGDDDDDAPKKKVAKKSGDDDDDAPKKKVAKKSGDDDDDDASHTPAKHGGFAHHGDDERGGDRVKKGDDDDDAPKKKVAAKKSGDDDDDAPKKKVAKKGDDDDDAPKKKVAKKGDDDDDAPKKVAKKSGDDDDDVKPHKKHKHTGDDDDAPKKGDDDSPADEEIIPAFDPATLTQGERMVEAGIGVSVTDRKLTFRSLSTLANPPPNYKGVPVAGVDFETTIYPLAYGHKRHDQLKNIGINLLIDRVVKESSQTSYTDGTGATVNASLATEQMRFGLGVVYRYPLGTGANAPVVGGMLRYGKQQFIVSHEVGGEPLPDGTVDLPNVHYSMAEIGPFIRYPLGAITLMAKADFLLVTNAGDIQTDAEYGGGKVTAFDLEGGLDYALSNAIYLRATARLEQFRFTFNGTGEETFDRSVIATGQTVTGVHDTYYGGAILIGFLY